MIANLHQEYRINIVINIGLFQPIRKCKPSIYFKQKLTDYLYYSFIKIIDIFYL